MTLRHRTWTTSNKVRAGSRLAASDPVHERGRVITLGRRRAGAHRATHGPRRVVTRGPSSVLQGIAVSNEHEGADVEPGRATARLPRLF